VINPEAVRAALPVQPPSQILLFLPAVREPLFADGAGKKVGRHAGHTPITAVLAGWLRPDGSHSPSPPLLVFAFVLFDKRQQFFIAPTRMHAVKAPALPTHLFRGDLP